MRKESEIRSPGIIARVRSVTLGQSLNLPASVSSTGSRESWTNISKLLFQCSVTLMLGRADSETDKKNRSCYRFFFSARKTVKLTDSWQLAETLGMITAVLRPLDEYRPPCCCWLCTLRQQGFPGPQQGTLPAGNTCVTDFREGSFALFPLCDKMSLVHIIVR